MNRLARIAFAIFVLVVFGNVASAQDAKPEPRERFAITGGGGQRTLVESTWIGNGGSTDTKFAGNTGELTAWGWINSQVFVKGSLEQGFLIPDGSTMYSYGIDKLRYEHAQALIGWSFPYGSIAGGIDGMSQERNQAQPYFNNSVYRTIRRTEMFGPVFELNLGKYLGPFYIGEAFQYSPFLPGTFRLISGQDGSAPFLDQIQSGHNWSAFKLAIKSELEIYRGLGLTMTWDMSRRSETDVDTFPGQEVNRQKDSQRFMVGAVYRFVK